MSKPNSPPIETNAPDPDDIKSKLNKAEYFTKEFYNSEEQSFRRSIQEAHDGIQLTYDDFHREIGTELCSAGQAIADADYLIAQEVRRAMLVAWEMVAAAGGDIESLPREDIENASICTEKQLSMLPPEPTDKQPREGCGDKYETGDGLGECDPPDSMPGGTTPPGTVPIGGLVPTLPRPNRPLPGGIVEPNPINPAAPQAAGGANPVAPPNAPQPPRNAPAQPPAQPGAPRPIAPAQPPAQPPRPPAQPPRPPAQPPPQVPIPIPPQLPWNPTLPPDDYVLQPGVDPIDPGPLPGPCCPDPNITVNVDQGNKFDGNIALNLGDDVVERGEQPDRVGGRKAPAVAPIAISNVDILLRMKPDLIAAGKLIMDHVHNDKHAVQTLKSLANTIAIGLDWSELFTRLYPYVDQFSEAYDVRTVLLSVMHMDTAGSKHDPRYESEYKPLATLRTFLIIASSAVYSFGSASSGQAGFEEHAKSDQKLGVKIEKFTNIGGGIGNSADISHADNTNASVSNRMEVPRYLIYLTDVVDYLLDSSYASAVPTIDQAIGAFLRGEMSADKAQAIVAFRGTSWADIMPVVRSRRDTLSAMELVAAQRRGHITHEQLSAELRRRGWLDEWDRDLLDKIATYVPPPSDVIRMMVRDVQDEKIVDWRESDREFLEKYNGVLRKYGEASSIDDETMGKYWRAHYRLPGITQALEAMHRCRPGTEAAQIAGRVVTEEDVKHMLAQDDLFPHWRGPIAAISYRPLTRVDAQRTYIIGAIDDKGLKEAYQDLHYPEKNAQILVEWTKERRVRWIERYPAVRAHVAGAMDRAELDRQTARFKWPSEQVNEAVSRLRNARRAKSAERCETALRKQYLTGKLDAPDMLAKLMHFGYPKGVAEQMLETWKCELSVTERSVPASTLCRWYKSGLISRAEYTERIIRIGYARADALDMARQCHMEMISELKKRSEMDAKKAEREEEAAKKRAARREREAEQAAARADREQKRQTKEDAARKKRQRKAVEKLAAKTRIAFDLAANLLETAATRVVEDYEFSPVEATFLVEYAALKGQFATTAEFLREVELQVDVDIELDSGAS